MKRFVARVLLAWIVIGVVVLAGLVAVRFHPPLGILVLALYRGHPACSAVQSYQSSRYRVYQAEMRRSLESQFRLVRQEGPYRLWETPQGPYWTPDSNAAVLPILVAQQMTGIYRVSSGGQSVKAGDIVLDCGAHIGTYTRQVLKEGAARVVAIEPAPANVECLRRNLAEAIQRGAVTVQPVGVWDRPDTLTLYEDPQNSAAAAFVHPGTRHRAGVHIPLTTIDRIVAELGLPRMDVIKMDIKGSSARALQGAVKTIRRHHPTIVVSTEEDGDDPTELLRLARQIDSRYSLACTSCSLDRWTIRPDVVVLR
jgi:FkbM family methyltransferase